MLIFFLAAYFLVPGLLAAIILVAARALVSRGKYSLAQNTKAAALLVVPLAFAIFFGGEALNSLRRPVAPPLETVKAETFKFENYPWAPAALGDALHKIFPTGTPKSYVDRILIDQADADCGACKESKIAPKTGQLFVNYIHAAFPVGGPFCNNPRFFVNVTYDKDLKLVLLKVRPDNGCAYP